MTYLIEEASTNRAPLLPPRLLYSVSHVSNGLRGGDP